MKKFLVIAAAAVMSLGAFAENSFDIKDIDINKVYVGGSIGAWRDQSANKTSVTILPEIGYTLDKTWAVGTQIGYKYVYNEEHLRAHNSSFILNPYVRWTALRAGIVQLFVDGGIDFSLGHTSWKGGSSKASASFGIGVKPGVAINFNKNFSMVAHVGFLGYQGANKAAEAGGFNKGFGFDFSNALNFGFYYNF